MYVYGGVVSKIYIEMNILRFEVSLSSDSLSALTFFYFINSSSIRTNTLEITFQCAYILMYIFGFGLIGPIHSLTH